MPAVRLVLSGGSARGLAECVGALGALFDRGNTVEIGAGTSAGGIALGALAAGVSPQGMRELVEGLDLTRFVSTGLLGKLRAAFKGCLSDGTRLLEFFRGVTKGKRFRDAGFDVRITGANYNYGTPRVFTRQTDPEMELAVAMRITSAMPLAFSAVEYDGQWYKDGGVYAHIPVAAAKDPLRTVIFALAEDPARRAQEAWQGDVGLLREVGRTVDLLVDANVRAELAAAPADAVKVFSDGLGIGSFRFDLTLVEKRALMAHGRGLMEKALQESGL